MTFRIYESGLLAKHLLKEVDEGDRDPGAGQDDTSDPRNSGKPRSLLRGHDAQ